MTVRLFLGFVGAFLLNFYSQSSEAEIIHLKGLKGGEEVVSIKADYPKGKIIVIGKSKCFDILNVIGLDGKIEILNNYFLKISVRERCGVGIDKRRTYLFTSTNQILQESLALQTKYEETITNTYSGDKDSSALNQHLIETLDYVLVGKDKFGMNIKFHEEKKNENSKVDNYSFNTKITLKFDVKTGLFYSEKKQLKGSFTFRISDNASSKKVLRNSYYCISIRGTTYYYINEEGIWMEEGNSNNLISYSALCSKS